MNLNIDKKKKIDTDLTNNNYFTCDPHESFIQTRILATYKDFFMKLVDFPVEIHLFMSQWQICRLL